MSAAPVEVRALSPERLPEFLAFFAGEAFADNPKWGSCYCQFLYVDHDRVAWRERTGAQNRAAACDRIRAGRMQGYLAYRGGRPVGWCSAGPRTMMDAFAGEPHPDAGRIGEITCFVVAKPHRRSGVARALLAAACEGLKAQGLAIAQAMPLGEADTDARNHYGPLSLYLAAGFREHRRDADGHVHVRLPLC